MNSIDYEKQINNKYGNYCSSCNLFIRYCISWFLMNHHFKDIGAFIAIINKINKK